MTYDHLDSARSAAESERRDRDRRELRADATTTPRQRRWLRVGLLVIGLAAIAGAVTVLLLDLGTLSEARPLDRVEVQGDGLVLHWTGPDCETVNRDRTEVTTTADEVRVTLHVDEPADGCPGGEVARRTTVEVGAPVGDRRVIDGACLLPAFLDDLRCAGQTTRQD